MSGTSRFGPGHGLSMGEISQLGSFTSNKFNKMIITWGGILIDKISARPATHTWRPPVVSRDASDSQR